MSEFSQMDLGGSVFCQVDLTGAEFRNVDFSHVVMKNVDLIDVEITASIENLRINGVDIGPLVNAELDRRYPLRAKMRPEDPDGFREAWDILEQLWEGTVDRARRLAPERLHESVNGEWSFIQTLRHLSFATDSWIRRAIQGDPFPWDPLGLPWSEMPDTPGVPNDLTARPSLATVLELRRDRMSVVREVIDGLTEESLQEFTQPVEEVGWPESRSYPVRQCLRIILNEEWEHRLYAERDLDVLFARDVLSE